MTVAPAIAPGSISSIRSTQPTAPTVLTVFGIRKSGRKSGLTEGAVVHLRPVDEQVGPVYAGGHDVPPSSETLTHFTWVNSSVL